MKCKHSWSFRGLTLIGKITVIKSLALSQLVHLFSVLEDQISFLDEIETVFMDFLWDGKPARIAKTALYNTVYEGGLKMVHVHSFSGSIKTSWVHKLLNPEKQGLWKTIFLDSIKHFGGTSIFRLNKPSVSLIAEKIKNVFWKNIILVWSNVSQEPDSIENILDQPIWYNNLIKAGNESLYNKKMMNSNILYIRDIFNTITGEKKPETFFKNIDPRLNFMNYRSLFRAIPSVWKESILEYAPFSATPSGKSLLSKFSKSTEPTKFIYRILILEIAKHPEKSQQKWESNEWFNKDRNWSDIYHSPHKCTEETRLITFQFNILHRAIFTNSRLFKANLSGTILCSFCNTHSETIEHLFYFCVKTRNLYLRLSHWINEYTNIEVDVTPNNFLFGIESSTVNNLALNNLILLAKRFVYVERSRGSTDLNFSGLKNYIKHRVAIEQLSSNSSGTDTFRKKWQNFTHFLV